MKSPPPPPRFPLSISPLLVCLCVCLCTVAAAFLPLIFFCKLPAIDYDSGGVAQVITRILSDGVYQFDRKPGSPAYSLLAAFWIKIWTSLSSPYASPHDPIRSLQYINLGMTLASLALFWFGLAEFKLDRWVRSCLVLAFGLHPLILWHGFALVEDTPALFFALASVALSRRGLFQFSAISMAVAIGCKPNSICILPLVLGAGYTQLEKQEERSNVLFNWILATATLSFLLFLPALSNAKMSIRWLLDLKHFTPPELRAKEGIYLATDTFIIIFPLSVFLFWQLARDRAKKGWASFYTWTLSQKILISFTLVYLLIFFRIVSFWWVCFLPCVFLALEARKKLTPKIMSYAMDVVSVLIGLAIMLRTPYSRSYLLFIIPSLLRLVARIELKPLNFQLLLGGLVFLTYLPMFFYFHFEPKLVFWVPRGFYHSLLNAQANEFNDTGFHHATDRRVVYSLIQ